MEAVEYAKYFKNSKELSEIAQRPVSGVGLFFCPRCCAPQEPLLKREKRECPACGLRVTRINYLLRIN